MDRGDLRTMDMVPLDNPLEYPISVPFRHIRIGNFYVTQGWWHNAYMGSCRGTPETGIRDLSYPCNDHRFTLVCHYDLNMDDALDEITWRLEAGHDPWEIERDVSELETPRVNPRLL